MFNMRKGNERDRLNQLREMIERAFDYKAERYSPSELADYFARRELLPTLTYQRMHHALKGRKGTGKTAILKYLSLPVQVHLPDSDKTDSAGFYLSFGDDFPPLISFDPQTEKGIAQLFGHWFNLYASKAVIDGLANAIGEGFQGMLPIEQKKFVATLWASFLTIQEAAPSSLRQASLALNDFQRELRTLLSAPSLDRTKAIDEYSQGSQYRYTGKVTDVVDFRAIFEILKQTVNSLSSKPFFVLMDEYDSLSASQQVVVNTAIAHSTGLCFTKLGVLSEQGLQSRITLSGLTLREDQLKLVDIEEFTTPRQYEDFVKACISARLTRIQRQVSGIPELENLFSDPDRLFPSKNLREQLLEQGIVVERRRHAGQLTLLDLEDEGISSTPQASGEVEGTDIDAWWTFLKNERQPAYCGITTICLLSSGFIRSAIEIIYAILKNAIDNHWHIVSQAGCIPYDIQNNVIREEADHWLTTKLQADIRGKTWDGEGQLADVARRLIRNLSKQFHTALCSTSKEVVLNRFSLRELRDPEADGIKVLQEGELTGIFKQLPESSIQTKDTMVFSSHRIYSVQDNLPPDEIGCLRLSWSKFEEYCRPPYGAVGKLEDAVIPYFFGTGFRQEWENRVRQELPHLSPSNYRYSDGAGAHEGSILVVGTVENRIDAAQLCIFDVTTQNENVCFEYGLALAKKKPIRHLLNQEKATIRHPNQLIPFLKGIVVERYNFSDNSTEEDLQSLKEAMGKCAQWYNGRRKSRRSLCSINAKCRFSSTPLETQVFLAAPPESLTSRYLPDLQRLIRDDLRLQISEVRHSGQGPYICHICQPIGRSRYCIVDTTGCDPTYCGILGLAFGFGRRVLNIYERGRTGLIANYAGHGPKEFSDKQELLNLVKLFLQS